jgi:hypothetical protein
LKRKAGSIAASGSRSAKVQHDVNEAREEAGSEEDVEGRAFKRLSHDRSPCPGPTGSDRLGNGLRDGKSGFRRLG